MSIKWLRAMLTVGVLVMPIAVGAQITAIDFLDNQIFLDFDGRYTLSGLYIELDQGEILNPDNQVFPTALPNDTFVALGSDEVSFDNIANIAGSAYELGGDRQESISGDVFSLTWFGQPGNLPMDQSGFLSAQIALSSDASGIFRYIAFGEGTPSWVDSTITGGQMLGGELQHGRPSFFPDPNVDPPDTPTGTGFHVSRVRAFDVNGSENLVQLTMDFEGPFNGAELLVELEQGQVLNPGGGGDTFVAAGPAQTQLLGDATHLPIDSSATTDISLSQAWSVANATDPALVDGSDFLLAQIAFSSDARGRIGFRPSFDGTGSRYYFLVDNGQIVESEPPTYPGFPEPGTLVTTGCLALLAVFRRGRIRG